MTVVIIIDKQRSEPLENHDISDYYRQSTYEPLENHDISN